MGRRLRVVFRSAWVHPAARPRMPLGTVPMLVPPTEGGPMPYLNVDDGMDEHPKVEGLSDAAFRLHVSGMLYAARRQTDGAVPRRKARRLSDTASDAVAGELVRAGVWHDLGQGCTDPECVEEKTCQAVGVEGAYLIHDYLQWNHSKAWWENRRREEAERKRKYRARKNGGAVDGA